METGKRGKTGKKGFTGGTHRNLKSRNPKVKKKNWGKSAQGMCAPKLKT
jgi:hypothetical protein